MKYDELKLGAILSYISIFLSNIVGLIYTPIMLRMLGQEEYGLYSLVGSMISYITIIDLGFGNATIRYLSKYRALGDNEKEESLNGMFIIINIVIGIIAFLLGLILYNNIDFFFKVSLTSQDIEKVKFMLLILTFNLSISFPFGVFGSIIVAHEKFIFPKLIGIIRTIINPIIILLVLSNGYRSEGMVLTNTIINLLFIWVNVYYCFKKLKIKFNFKKFDCVLFREILGYCFFIFLAVIVDKIYWSTDQFILGVFSGPTAISIYSIASQINMYYMQFSTSISGMFLPKITSMIVKNVDNHELTDIFIRVGRIQFIILGLILSSFILFGKTFIMLWAGEEYMEAFYITLILITPFTIPLIQNIGLSILQAKNMHRFRSITYFFIAIGNLLISIPLAKYFGGIGCAIGTAISMIIGNIIIINIYYHKKVGIDIIDFWKNISLLSIPMIISIICGVLINSLFVGETLILFMMKGLLFSIIYIALVYTLGMNTFEKETFNTLFQRFKILKLNTRKIV